jgi:hypothetical protein
MSRRLLGDPASFLQPRITIQFRAGGVNMSCAGGAAKTAILTANDAPT